VTGVFQEAVTVDDKQLQKLIRQNAARAAKAAKARNGRQYDQTLPPTRDDADDIERAHFFKEMKRREF
jgi:hypothetical protein